MLPVGCNVRKHGMSCVCGMAVVQARLHAMEGKILKGAAREGLVELTRLKEEQLKRREVELQRRYVSK
jgi:hypothetical protein